MNQQKGNSQSQDDPFEALLSRHKGMLFRLCRRLSGREATVEDLMQEMTLALWRQLDRLRTIPEGPKRKVWVWRVAHNAAVDYLRRSPGHQELDAEQAARIAEEDHSLVAHLRELIALLEEPDRTIVRMQLEGYRYDEIAERLGISKKNVSVRLVRAKETLRNQMNANT